MTMGDRNNSPSSTTILLRRNNILFNLIILASILVIWSWIFARRSTNDPPPPYAMYNNPDHDHHRYYQQDSGLTVSDQRREDTVTSTSEEACGGSEADSKKYGGGVVKVYMYDLPIKFHFGMLGWKPAEEGSDSIWPDIRTTVPHYPGGLNLQHSVEYWLTLDLLRSSELPASSPATRPHVLRVRDSSEADVIFVPFFSSLCYNRYSKVPTDPKTKTRKKNKSKMTTRSLNTELQDELVEFLESQEEWKRSGGMDHIILAHHPNSLLEARNQLYPAMFILSDFGRYPTNVANVEKDIVTPYKHMIQTYVNDTSTFHSRTTLLYFQGAIHRKGGGSIRQELHTLLRDEQGVHFQSGSVQNGGVRNSTLGMKNSKYCLNIAGDTPSSNRLFDSIVSHCVPVIISDDIELPYEDVIDYSEFCVFVRNSDAIKKGYVISLIKGIEEEEWTRMWKRLLEVDKHFEFGYPSEEDDAVRMIWKAVSRKVRGIRLRVNRYRRYCRSVTDDVVAPGDGR